LQKAAGADADFRGKDESQARLSVLAIDPSTADAGTRAALDNYLRREPNDPAALARVAQLQLRDGKPDQAIKTYERIIADNPLYAPATRQLAILSAEGATDAAKAYDVAQKARQTYPNDPEVAKALEVVVPVQVNGKLRARITAAAGASEDQLRELALADPGVRAHTDGKTIRKVMVAKGPLVSVVVS